MTDDSDELAPNLTVTDTQGYPLLRFLVLYILIETFTLILLSKSYTL